MNGSQAFYGFAALIIPVLLFGGAVTEQWTPQKRNPASKILAGGVVVAMLFAIAAEVVAIDAAFTGSTSALGGAIVVGVVILGTVAAAGAVTWPWKSSLGPLYPLVVVCTLVAAVALSWTTFDGISATGSGSGSNSDAVAKAVRQIADEQRAEASDLGHLAGQDVATGRALRNAFDLLTAEMARTRAADAALIRAAEER